MSNPNFANSNIPQNPSTASQNINLNNSFNEISISSTESLNIDLKITQMLHIKQQNTNFTTFINAIINTITSSIRKRLFHLLKLLPPKPQPKPQHKLFLKEESNEDSINNNNPPTTNELIITTANNTNNNVHKKNILSTHYPQTTTNKATSNRYNKYNNDITDNNNNNQVQPTMTPKSNIITYNYNETNNNNNSNKNYPIKRLSSRDIQDFPFQMQQKTSSKASRPSIYLNQMTIHKTEVQPEEPSSHNNSSELLSNNQSEESQSLLQINDDDGDDNNNNNNNNQPRLIEYDQFYKEDFFKNELFKQELNFITNKEETEIQKDIDLLKTKKLLQTKLKLKDIQIEKKQDTTLIDKEIQKIKETYTKLKTIPKPQLDLNVNNTTEMLSKGRQLDFYLKDTSHIKIFPKLSIENEKSIKGKEIIDFKELSPEEKVRRYYDPYSCFKCRKGCFKLTTYAQYYFGFVVDNNYFEYFSLLVIITNTILILVSDPRDNKSVANVSDPYFLYFYTLEAILKIIGFGFICSENAYLRDYWNILDFLVVIVGWISWILERTMENKKISGLAGLRAFRILRPLKTVKSIKVLRRLIIALLASITKLSDILIVLFFFILLFAIGGVQMWQGVFMRRCMSLQYGYMSSFIGAEGMCTFDSDCLKYNTPGNTFVCVKSHRNPDNGITNFDNSLKGFVTIFIILTMEGWSDIFLYVSSTFKDKLYLNPIITFLFFHAFIIMGGFYLLNLFLAVTNSEFMGIEQRRKELLVKPSLLTLMKNRYDITEMEKQEQKRKAKEMQNKNKRKTEDDVTDLKIKIKEEAYEIDNNIKDIPYNYTTIKDLYILQNSNPEELYVIDKLIDEEKKYLKDDIKRQLKELDLIESKNSSSSSDDNSDDWDNERKRLKKKKKNKKKGTTTTTGVIAVTTQSSALNNSINSSNSEGSITEANKRNYQKFILSRQKGVISEPVVKIAMHYAVKSLQDAARKPFIKDGAHAALKQNNNNSNNNDVGRSTRGNIMEIIKRKMEKMQIEKYKDEQVSYEEDLEEEKEEKQRQKKEALMKKDKLHNESSDITSKYRNTQKHSTQLIDNGGNDSSNNNTHQRVISNDESSIVVNNKHNTTTNVNANNNNNDNNKHQLKEELSFLTDMSLSSINSNDNSNNNGVGALDNSNSFMNDGSSYLISNRRTRNNNNNNTNNNNANINAPHRNGIHFPHSDNNSNVLLQNNNVTNTVSSILIDVNSNFPTSNTPINTVENDNDSSISHNNNDNPTNNNSIIIKKSFPLNNNINFHKPSYMLSDLIKLKNDISLQNRIQRIRNNFNLDECLTKVANNGIPISSLGRKRSFLKFLRNEDDTNNLVDAVTSKEIEDNDLDGAISLNISNASHISDISMLNVNHQQQMGGVGGGNNNMDSLEIDDVDVEILNTKYTYFGRSAFLDKNSKNSMNHLNGYQMGKLFKKLNYNLNSNILINNREPKKRDDKILNISTYYKQDQFKDGVRKGESHNNNNNNSRSHSSNSNTNTNNSNINDKEIALLYKSPSIDKNEHKYPRKNTTKFIVEERNEKITQTLTPQQELISDNWRSRKYYMNYLYNIKQHDVKVKDTFNIGYWKPDILGHEQNTIPNKQLPESSDAIYVFNDKKLNLKQYRYITYKQHEFKENEIAYLTNNLKNFPLNVLSLMPPRLRNYGSYAVGKEINLGNLQTSTLMHNSSSTSKVNHSTNKGKSSYTHSTIVNLPPPKGSDESKYRKGLHEKVFRLVGDFNYKTLHNYFLEEERLYGKIMDDVHKDTRAKEIIEGNREKYNVLQVKESVRDVKIFDLRTNSVRYVQWSGDDVMYMNNNNNSSKDIDKLKSKHNEMIYNLENFGVIIWTRAPCIKQLQKIKYGLFIVSTNTFVEIAIIIVVVANSIIMALDGNIFKPETVNTLNISNYVFNSIFIAEFIIKFCGLGPVIYFSDPFTYLDLLIIAFAIVDMASPTTVDTDEIGANKSITSQLGFLRVFRIFRVLRLTKILRKLKSMRLIIVSIQKSIVNLLYILMILLMFLLIFQLLGMSLLNGNILYQSFLNAFYTTFQILTVEGWNKVFIELYPMSAFVFFYFLIWIFLGNYILFNLFISILLQSFDGSDKEDETEDEMIERTFNLPDYLYALKLEEEYAYLNNNNNNNNNGNSSNFKHKKRFKEQQHQHTSLTASTSHFANSNLNNNNNSNASLTKSEDSNYDMNSSFYGTSSYNMDEYENDDEHGRTTTAVLTAVDKSIQKWKQVNELFKKNECENSLYLLSQVNAFRIFCMKIISSKPFDVFILILILLSTLRLILGTIINGYQFVFIFDIIDLCFNIIFTIEMILKVIALGLVMDEGSYLRDHWNKMDFIIVVFSLIDIKSFVDTHSNTDGDASSLSFLKVVRLFRTLRLLRLISHNFQLRLLISSLFDSLLPIISTLLIVVIVFFMFSIVGINLFYNLYHNCYVPAKQRGFTLADNDFTKYLYSHNVDNNMPAIAQFCADRYNGIMDTGPTFKFDNIFNSLVTSYVLSTMEGWPELMNEYRVFNDFYGIFFLVYILVVSYFFLNLFTGVMFKYFNDAWKRERQLAEGDKKAPKYFDFLQLLEHAEPDYNCYLRYKEGTVWWYLSRIALSKWLDNFIMIVIFLNMIIMAINYDGTGPAYSKFLEIANLIFTSIFIAECVFKIFSLGIFYYFSFGWNVFDFFVVIASIADLVIARIDGIDAAFLKSFQIIRVLRVLRVTRVLRLFRALKNLEKMIQTIRWSISALINVFMLMLLIFCIFAILGYYLYENIDSSVYGDEFIYLNEWYNLDNFYFSFLLVFRCATGEGWPDIMLELAYIDPEEVSSTTSYVFMIFMTFFAIIIMLNLFLMVTLQQYDEFTNKTYNPLELYETYITEFQRAWNKFSLPVDKGFRIQKKLVADFLIELKWKKLDFPKEDKMEHVKNYIFELELYEDEAGYCYFHDVCYKVVLKQMGMKIERNNAENGLIFNLEKKISNKFKMKILKYIKKKKINKRKALRNELIKHNPLPSYIYSKMAYYYIKMFIEHYKDNAEILFNQESDKMEYDNNNNNNGGSSSVKGNNEDRNGSYCGSKRECSVERGETSHLITTERKEGMLIEEEDDNGNGRRRINVNEEE